MIQGRESNKRVDVMENTIRRGVINANRTILGKGCDMIADGGKNANPASEPEHSIKIKVHAQCQKTIFQFFGTVGKSSNIVACTNREPNRSNRFGFSRPKRNSLWRGWPHHMCLRPAPNSLFIWIFVLFCGTFASPDSIPSFLELEFPFLPLSMCADPLAAYSGNRTRVRGGLGTAR